MAFIDVHSHIPILGDEKAFMLINEAAEKGMSQIIINSLDSNSYEEAKAFKKRYEKSGEKVKIRFAAGMYPYSGLRADVESGAIEKADFDYGKLAKIIEEEQDNICAVGEIGLDFKDGDKDNAGKDIECFRLMLKTAQKLKKPVIIHSRKAEAEVIDIISEYNVTAVLHCFSGKLKLAKKALENKKVYFSIPLIITHSEHFQHLARIIPLNRILTETDTPFMPLKGKEISEPGDITEAISKIAEVKGMDYKEMENIILGNALRIF